MRSFSNFEILLITMAIISTGCTSRSQYKADEFERREAKLIERHLEYSRSRDFNTSHAIIADATLIELQNLRKIHKNETSIEGQFWGSLSQERTENASSTRENHDDNNRNWALKFVDVATPNVTNFGIEQSNAYLSGWRDAKDYIKTGISIIPIVPDQSDRDQWIKYYWHGYQDLHKSIVIQYMDSAQPTK